MRRYNQGTTSETPLVRSALLILTTLAAGCIQPLDETHSSGSSAATTVFRGVYPIKATATVGMVADLVRNIGGKHVTVDCLMGPGVDPHRYKTTPGDVRRLRSADVIFFSGHHLEGKMAEVLHRLAAYKPTLAAAEWIDESLLLREDDGAADPHAWFDVSIWKIAADAVTARLVVFDPGHADDYRRNAAAYALKMDELHRYAQTTLAEIPKDRRVLVTAHDAFRYFGRAYGVEVRGIQGISTDDEAGVKHVNDLVSFLIERKVKAVFVETSVSDRNLRAVLEGCNARGWKVELGAELFSDALGDDGTEEGTYLGMVRHNVDAIAKALR
jgi:manganese/zinc/iron transport system substrate-binding protein